MTHPALVPEPASGLDVGLIRERFAVAFAAMGGELSEAHRIAVAIALARQSPVDMAIDLFNELIAPADPDDETGPKVWESLGAVLLARAIEAADLIAANLWHGKASEASAFGAAARAALADMAEF